MIVNPNTVTAVQLLVAIEAKNARYVSARALTNMVKYSPRINSLLRTAHRKGFLTMRKFENEKYELAHTPFYSLTDLGREEIGKYKQIHMRKINRTITAVRTTLKNAEVDMTSKDISRATKRSHKEVVLVLRKMCESGEAIMFKDEGQIFWAYND